MKKNALPALLLALLLALGGCVEQVSETPVPESPLPDIAIDYQAPLGDGVETRRIPAVLYYLNQDATYLVTHTTQVEVEGAQTPAEAVMRALFAEVPQGMYPIAPAGVELDKVSHPVMVCDNVATVILTAAARSLLPQELYTLRLAITNTLTELSGIDYVVVLVGGREEGLDLGGTLPAGAMSHVGSGDVVSQWSQQEVLREHAEEQGIGKAVALYMPAAGERYVVPRVRNVSFSGTSEVNYTMEVLRELGKAAAGEQEGPIVEQLESYLVEPTFLLPMEDGAERIIRLAFDDRLESVLMQQNIGKGLFFAMLCHTLIGFVPRVDGIQVSFGGTVINALEGVDTIDHQEVRYEEGLLRRSDFIAYVGSYTGLYFPTAGYDGLRQVQRAVPVAQARNPRAMLRQLLDGLMPHEGEGLAAALPPEVEDADILGVQVVDDVALVHVTQRFADAAFAGPQERQRGAVYAMVHLLCALPQVQRVAFFVEGRQMLSTQGLLEYQGFFYPNPGYVQ